MNVRNCRKCGKIFNYVIGPPICPACREGMEKKFQEVKEYVRANKNVGIREVAEVCEIEVSQIQQWIREERLVFADDSPIGINCESCGTMIKTGRYCDRCKNETARGFNDSIKSVKEEPAISHSPDKTNPKMRFLQ